VRLNRQKKGKKNSAAQEGFPVCAALEPRTPLALIKTIYAED
jgi:hypothetical protein